MEIPVLLRKVCKNSYEISYNKEVYSFNKRTKMLFVQVKLEWIRVFDDRLIKWFDGFIFFEDV